MILQVMSPHGINWAGDEGGRERTYDGKASTWQRRAPTWGGVASPVFPCVEMEDGTGRGMALESSREPLMAPSGRGSTDNIGGCGVAKGEVCFIPLLVQAE